MKKLLITTAALSFALVGCKTTEPPTFEQETNDIYVWDDSKSTAKNWADIAVVPNGIKDAERAEDAQELISEAEQNAWTLLSFASGGLAQGLGMSSVFGIIDDAQRWWPTFVILVEPQDLNHKSILEEVSKQFEPMFEASGIYNYEGISYRTTSRGWANTYILASGEGCQYRWSYKKVKEEVLSVPKDYEGCLMDAMVRLMPRVQMPSGEVYDVITVEPKTYSRWSLKFASSFDGPVVFPVNYKVKLDGKESAIPFPFVYYNDKAHLFTKSDATLEINIQ